MLNKLPWRSLRNYCYVRELISLLSIPLALEFSVTLSYRAKGKIQPIIFQDNGGEKGTRENNKQIWNLKNSEMAGVTEPVIPFQWKPVYFRQ